MEFLTNDGAVAWPPRGIKELLDSSEGIRKSGDAYHIEELEPTSVLDVGSRFSPPITCTCPSLDASYAHTHTDPSCPHAQVCQDGFTHLLADQFQLRFSSPGFDQWGEAAYMMHENHAASWVNQDHDMFCLPHMENTASWVCNSMANSASSASFDDDAYPQSYNDGVMQDNYIMVNDMHTPSSGTTSANMMRSSEEDEFVNMYINHTEEMTGDEPETTCKASKMSCKSSSNTKWTSLLTDSKKPHMACTSTTDYKQDHTLEDNLSMDDSYSFGHLANQADSILVTSHPQGSLEDYDQFEPKTVPSSTHIEYDDNGQDNGLQLVHLLLACAEAVAWRDLALAASLLERLNVFASYAGDSIQRVTYCFAEGLSARLATMSRGAPNMQMFASPNIAERKEGLLQLYMCSPYISFGFFAANQAILQAFEKKTQVHIVDLGMMQNLQWPGLIRALATRAEGPPMVRISAFGAGMESVGEMHEWGRELKEFASSLNVSLEFRVMGEALDTSKLNAEELGVRESETLAINSVLQLHKVVKESRGSLKGVLQRLQKLGVGAMTVIEQDASHNGPFFLGRFLEALHYYSAIFDSMEASKGRQSQQRMKVERLYYAEEIRNIVACEGAERVERHERGDQWRRQMSRAGFQAMPLKCISQARMLLSLYSCDGYSLCEDKGSLILGWKGKPIMFASAWKASPSNSSTPHTKKPPLILSSNLK